MSLNNKKILVLMTGSIAAFKACGVISKLVQAGAKVKVVQSKSATEFIGNATVEGLTGVAAIRDELFTSGQIMDHIYLMREADLILVCPATANYINKIASGVGDDLLSTLFLAHDFKKPFLIAPAMNTAMYLHPVTQQSIQKLSAMGLEILEAASGVLACGENGVGKLLEPDLIVAAIEATSKKIPSVPTTQPQKSLKQKVLITGGGTIEPLDEVRYIGNHSTGATAAHLADAFFDLGFDVCFLAARNSVRPQREIQIEPFVTFADLQNSLQNLLSSTDFKAVIHLAAVSDYSIASIESATGQKLSQQKIASGQNLTLKLKPNPKLIASLREWSRNKAIQICGFKMTVQASPQEAQSAAGKVFSESTVDWVIHNDTSEISTQKHNFKIFDKNLNVVAHGQSKSEMANSIYTLLAKEEK